MHCKQQVMDIIKDIKLTDISNTCWQQKIACIQKKKKSIEENTEKQPQHIFEISHATTFCIMRTKKNSQRFIHLHGWINLLFIIKMNLQIKSKINFNNCLQYPEV